MLKLRDGGLIMKHIQYLYRFNSRVRKKYLDAFKSLPWDEVIKDSGASFGSMRDIFVHVLDAYRYWFDLINCKDVKKFEGTDLKSIRNVDDLKKFEGEVDGTVMETVQNLKEDDLLKDCYLEIHDISVSMESILLHMIEEELQHRGEINCIFWQMNLTPPIGDVEDLMQAMK